MGLLRSLRASIGNGAPAPKAAQFEERRRHRRMQSVKLTILIGAQRYKTKDWSLGGMRIDAPGLCVNSNEPISGWIHGPGLFDRGDFEGIVSWVSEQGEIGIRFVEVSRETFLSMSMAQS